MTHRPQETDRDAAMRARIFADHRFSTLAARRNRLGWQLTAVMMAVYYAFILVVAFAPSLLALPLTEGSITTIGIPIGVFIILLAIGLTGFYVHRANTVFDAATDDILRDAGRDDETKESPQS